MTKKDLDEIEAQIDDTVPYYLPALLTLARRALDLDELVANWRGVGRRLQRQDQRFHSAGDQLLECADELEAKGRWA